jgi:DNA-binding SARP family transcriptional activator/tetratricopeptide (TPR) repeat protein
LEIAILGPVEIIGPRGVVGLPGTRPRLVLAALALNLGARVGTDSLVDLLWADLPPPSARKNLHTYVWSVRAAMARADADPACLTGVSDGYRLCLDDDQCDWRRFARLVRAARSSRETDPAHGADCARSALALWRGPVADGIADRLTRYAGLLNELEEGHRAVRLELARAEMALGHVDSALDTVGRLADQYPLWEEMRELQMLALYQAGRQAEALRVFVECQRSLAEELGADPGESLRHCHAAILRQEPIVNPVSRGAPDRSGGMTPRQLPADIPDFTGRETELARIDRLLDMRPAAAVVISGMGGSGKTTLTVHAGHRLADRYPDGQLFADLRGWGSHPRRPGDVLWAFLRALGIPAEHIPEDLDDRASCFRSAVADQRLLVVLDNVRSEEQATPLLPAGPGTAAVITSRRVLALTGARHLRLKDLSHAQARRLLIQVAGGRAGGADAATVDAIVEACGGLPLAIRLAGTRLALRERREPAEFAVLLADPARHRLLDSGESPVDQAFASSYESVSDEHRMVLRCVALLPGQDFSIWTASALTGLAVPEVTALLDGLCAVSLVEADANGRFRLHDLIRTHARRRSSPEEGLAGLTRLVTQQVTTVRAASRLVAPSLTLIPLGQPDRDCVPPLADQPCALAWFDQEYPALADLVLLARDHGLDQAAWLLADGMRGYFYRRRHTDPWAQVTEAGLSCATRTGDRMAQGAMLASKGLWATTLSQFDAAIGHYREALAACRDANWREGEAATLGNLGSAEYQRGRLDTAMNAYRAALEINRSIGNLRGVAVQTGNLGGIHRDIGDETAAEECYLRAMAVHELTGSEYSQALMAVNLANLEAERGAHGQAIQRALGAMQIFQKAGSQPGVVLALLAAARGHVSAGCARSAQAYAERACAYAAGSGDLRLEVDARNMLGAVLTSSDAGNARQQYLSARRIAASIGFAYGEAEALIGIARLGWQAGSTSSIHSPELAEARRIVQRHRFAALENKLSALLSAPQPE